MKKIRLFMLALALFALEFSYAGGIMTNTNQSAAWVRMMCRDAVIGVDGVYFNPAGLTQMGEGVFFSVSNQTLVQNRYITSDYQYLANAPVEYEGIVSAPLFPSVYGAYNTGKLSISFGFNIIGGGGGATFEDGLPSFEYSVSELVPALQTTAGVTQYSFDAYFKGTSVYYGIQLGAAYQINDMISVFLGGRYVMAKNTYEGHLKDIMINPGGGAMTPASEYFTALDESLASAVSSTQQLVDGGAGASTLALLELGGVITAEERATLEGGLLSIGYSQAQIDAMDVNNINNIYEGAYTAQHPVLMASATLTADQEADVVQTGSGFTPIIGANFKLNEQLNIGVKYEMNTKIELTNETAKDVITGFDDSGNAITMFPDGEVTRADMPAMLSVGASYQVVDNLMVTGGFHYYFDKAANYGKKIDDAYVDNDVVIDRGLMEFALGAEYAINDKFKVSAGYLNTNTGVNEDYHTDLSHSLSTSSFGFGVGYALTENLEINLGGAMTSYVDGEKTIDREDPTDATGTSLITIKETYDRDVMFFGVGVDIKL